MLTFHCVCLTLIFVKTKSLAHAWSFISGIAGAGMSAIAHILLDQGHTVSGSDLQANVLPEGTQNWIFWLFAIAFLVKMPAFPVHGWMPDGYRNMPLPVLAVFSAVLSKVAAYGFLKIALPLFPVAAADFQLLMLVLALASILYGSAMAFTTTEIRLILGYSSIAQLGFITLGIFALDEAADGAQGALLQVINHGLVVAPLFLIIALLAARAGGSEDIRDMGGIAFRAPVLAVLFLIVALANLAMPGFANFVGEPISAVIDAAIVRWLEGDAHLLVAAYDLAGDHDALAELHVVDVVSRRERRLGHRGVLTTAHLLAQSAGRLRSLGRLRTRAP